MKRPRLAARLSAALSGVHMVDRCLILFMAILLLQSAYSLFFHGGPFKEVGNIDVIVRTSTAAIFGYFLSANFSRRSAAGPKQTPHPPSTPPREAAAPPQKDTKIQNRIGFSAADPVPAPNPGQGGAAVDGGEESEQADTAASSMQVIAATGIGLFCLVALLILRNLSQWTDILQETPSVTATVAQFRDFVSGCVGFLIGCPTTLTKRKKT